MTVAEIISLTRDQTGGTTTGQISDAQMLIYLNKVYQEVFAEISEKSDKKQVRQEWTGDTVVGQSEYTLPKLNTTTSFPGLKQLINIYIKYKSTDDYYTKVRVLDYEIFSQSDDYLSEYDENKLSDPSTGYRKYPYPFAVRADIRSIFINPAPNEAITDGLKIQGTYTPLDLALTDLLEDDIKLQREYHELLSLGMEKFVRGKRQIDSKRNIAINRYMVMKQNVMTQMDNIPENAFRDSLPGVDLAYLA